MSQKSTAPLKHFSRADLKALPRIQAANLINSITGYKPANLIATRSSEGRANVAVFSSVLHLGANPPLVGFVQRPIAEIPAHTYRNIKATGCFTINHIHQDFVENAHFTSAKFGDDVSEFEACGLEPEYIGNFQAPFVRQSQVKLGLRYVDEHPIKQNDTIFVIGEIEHLVLPEAIIGGSGRADLTAVQDVCISGLDTYLSAKILTTLPYAKVDSVPDL